MNLNKTLDSIKDLRIIIAMLVALFCTGATCGYLLSPKPIIKAIMCKNEISQIAILNKQLAEIRVERLDDISRVQKKCLVAQDKICAEKITKYRAACLSLKCEICKASR